MALLKTHYLLKVECTNTNRAVIKYNMKLSSSNRNSSFHGTAKEGEGGDLTPKGR